MGVRKQIFHYSLFTFHFFFVPLQPICVKATNETGVSVSHHAYL